MDECMDRSMNGVGGIETKKQSREKNGIPITD